MSMTEVPPAGGVRADRPELTVPLVADDSTVERWLKADAAGSADAAFAVGTLFAQRGDRSGALAAWRRAEARGSAEAAYALGFASWSTGQQQAAEDAWRRAAERGCPVAAYAIAALAEARGDEVQTRRLVDRALALARAADEQGSADGACVLAQLLAWKHDARASEAAWRRADERGAVVGAWVVSHIAWGHGEPEEAEAAAARADERGLAAGAYVHGNFLYDRGDHAAARAAWRRARRLAAAQGDANIRIEAQRALHPSGRAFLRARRGRTLLTVVGLVATAALVGVAAAIAVLLALAAVYAWNRPLRPGTPVDASPVDTSSGLGIGGISVSGDVGVPMKPGDEAPSVRPATLRDTAYFRAWPLALGAGALVFASLAAGAIDWDGVLRAGLLAYALVILWQLAWAAPTVLRGTHSGSGGADEPEAWGTSRDSSMALDVAVPTLVPFVSWTFHMAVSEPRLEPLVRWTRERRQANAERDEWARRTRGILVLTGWCLGAAFFAALALVPERDDAVRIASDTASSVLAIGTLAVGLGLALIHGIRALRDGDGRALAGALGYVAAAAAVFAIAWRLGFLDGWLSVLDSIS